MCEMRGHACLPLLTMVLACAAGAPAANAATGQELVTVAPVVSYKGLDAPHLCFVSGSFRVGDADVPADPQFCFFIFAPIRILAGDLFFVRTPAEATATTIRPSSLDDPTACERRAPGRWRCVLPETAGDSSALYVGSTYPDAQALWRADLTVAHDDSKISRLCGDLKLTPRKTAREILTRGVRCNRARRVARNFIRRGSVPGWSCYRLRRTPTYYRCTPSGHRRTRLGRDIVFRVAPVATDAARRVHLPHGKRLVLTTDDRFDDDIHAVVRRFKGSKPDRSFGVRGRSEIRWPGANGSLNFNPLGLVVLPDRRIVVAGTHTFLRDIPPPGNAFALAALTPRGIVDQQFGPDTLGHPASRRWTSMPGSAAL